MSHIRRINKKLAARYGDRVSAREEDGCIVLSGELENWEDIVAAGRLAVDRRRYAGLVNDIVFTGGKIPPMRVPSFTDSALAGKRPDVLVVGGGVIGCAVARELTRWKLDVLVCEKEHDVALHASSRNDGMIHPGIDLLPGQSKRRYNLRGNAMYDRLAKELDVPFQRTGQYLCFQRPGLAILSFLAQGWFRLMGLPVRFLTKKQFEEKEPALNQRIFSALFFPTAGIICPYGLTIALGENAVDNGAVFSFDTAVTGMDVSNGIITAVHTNRGDVFPKVVVNAAGVFSDQLAAMAKDRFFSIHPRRGTNTILDKKAHSQIRGIASSYGTQSTHKRHTKGGGIVSTVDGNVLVGPDAFETPERENFETSAASLRDTFEKQRYTSPGLTQRDAITYFTGVRAATYEEDFVICKGRRTHNLVHAAGIQSPGLTAAPAIGEDVAKMAVALLSETREVERNPNFQPVRKGIVRLAALPEKERNAWIRKDPAYGEIVCRCEEVSRGEIRDALHRSLPCDTVDGVKRRVRPGMGRCQGGFCGPAVVKILSQELGIPLERVKKSGLGSELLLGRDKEANPHETL